MATADDSKYWDKEVRRPVWIHLARVRKKGGEPTQLKAAEAGQPFTAEGGYEVSGQGDEVQIAVPGKNAQSCHV